MKFNERLKMLRLEKGLTQKALATRLGVGRTTISEYESGNITPKQEGLLMLSDILNVSVDYLTGVSDDPLPKSTTKDVRNKCVETSILYIIKMLCDDEQVVKYKGVALDSNQKRLMKEQLKTTMRVLDHISRIDV